MASSPEETFGGASLSIVGDKKGLKDRDHERCKSIAGGCQPCGPKKWIGAGVWSQNTTDEWIYME